ncbi:MAG TPA: hypothetical protein VL120_02440, partial [Solirubrobacteraceae bacterium]|nr:hypothetical protein [Solirubrobacteraceae bacterium]
MVVTWSSSLKKLPGGSPWVALFAIRTSRCDAVVEPLLLLTVQMNGTAAPHTTSFTSVVQPPTFGSAKLGATTRPSSWMRRAPDGSRDKVSVVTGTVVSIVTVTRATPSPKSATATVAACAAWANPSPSVNARALAQAAAFVRPTRVPIAPQSCTSTPRPPLTKVQV